jgi:hypothetical protein
MFTDQLALRRAERLQRRLGRDFLHAGQHDHRSLLWQRVSVHTRSSFIVVFLFITYPNVSPYCTFHKDEENNILSLFNQVCAYRTFGIVTVMPIVLMTATKMTVTHKKFTKCLVTSSAAEMTKTLAFQSGGSATVWQTAPTALMKVLKSLNYLIIVTLLMLTSHLFTYGNSKFL